MVYFDKSNFPLQPPKSTELRLAHFDETVFRADPTTFLYKFVDAICGDAGAASLLKDTLLDRFSIALETLYFSDLDYIFGGMEFLERSESESYPYDPATGVLTSDEWDEVRIKDSWYRARIKEFFEAATLGGTPNGMRAVVQAGMSVNCEIFEVWRYKDSYGLTQDLGRAPVTSRNEFVVRPHKENISPRQKRLVLQMLNRVAPVDTIVTLDEEGLGVNSPVPVQSVTADSSYFEVQKEVVGSPVLQDIPAPELLAIDIHPSENWLFSESPEIAPYAAFNITQEYGYYYLVSGGARSPIDSVQYTKSQDGHETPEGHYVELKTHNTGSEWREYEKADSPDNYPGGKYGVTPDTAPAKTPTGAVYNFPYSSQEEYVEEKKAEVVSRGGYADDTRYRLDGGGGGGGGGGEVTRIVYTPDLSVAYSTPTKESTVTQRWTRQDTRRLVDTILRPVQNGVGISAGIVL